MNHFPEPSLSRLLPLLVLGSCFLGCTAELGNPYPGAGGTTNLGSGGGPGASGGTSAGGSGGTAGCVGTDAVSAKRVVRLSFNQIATSLGSLVDATLGTEIVEEFELVDAQHRAFPPLQSPREGNSFTDQSWSAADQIAQYAGKYVVANVDTLTGCGTEPTDDCALGYLTNLARKAYRRPLSAAESERLTTLYNTAFRGDGATVTESLEYGVYAIFQAPQFLYRTEFGMDAETAGSLTQLELASALSYFLTDDAPDELLSTAAEQGALSTPAELGAHVDRLLQTDAAKANLEGAMISYFAYPNLETQIIQDDAFTGQMRQSMFREAELFLQRALWGQPLSEMLISRKGYVDSTLAPLYGIETFPPTGAVPYADTFYEIELPENRTGLLTQAGFLANRSRPDHTSVVGRGLLIKNAFLCTETPLPSETITDIINQLLAENPDATERELADIRAETPGCASCHDSFDPYGLALDTYDVLGRYREVDDHGRPIDPQVTLPEVVGGGHAANIVEVATQLAASGAFAKCMGQNLVNYALADVSAGAATIDSCASERVAEAFATTGGTFPDLIKAVVTSAAFRDRVQGETP